MSFSDYCLWMAREYRNRTGYSYVFGTRPQVARGICVMMDWLACEYRNRTTLLDVPAADPNDFNNELSCRIEALPKQKDRYCWPRGESAGGFDLRAEWLEAQALIPFTENQ